jgi:superfamily I DNA/RNA helicase
MINYSYQLAVQLKALIDKVRVTLTVPTEENLVRLLQRFTDIDINPEEKETWPLVVKAVPYILEQGIKLAQVKAAPEIDFTDQIWLPSSHALNLTPNQYDVVLIDEAQDLSPCQRELVMKACKPGGMKIYVGDRDQSIFAFAGASLRSMDEVIEAERPHIEELPLSICYRCPTNVITFASTIRPGIEAAPDAPAGQVEYIDNSQVMELAQPGDLILCRLNAPLVEMCLSLLRAGKRATVRGMDLGQRFEGLIERIVLFYQQKRDPAFTNALLYQDLITCANDYKSEEIAILSENEEENEERLAQLEDNIETLLALYEGHRRETRFPNRKEPFSLDFTGFIAFIKYFFQEDKDAQIILSTGHKAKGLEFPVVFILSWNRLPHSRAITKEALKQERNLMYVMATRVLFDKNNPRSGILYLGYDKQPEDESEQESYRDDTSDEGPQRYESHESVLVASNDVNQGTVIEDLIAYLRWTGWKRLNAPDDDPLMFGGRKDLMDNPVMLSVPTNLAAPETLPRLAKVIETLGEIDQISTASVIQQIEDYRNGIITCVCGMTLRSLHDLFGPGLQGHLIDCDQCDAPRAMHVGQDRMICISCGITRDKADTVASTELSESTSVQEEVVSPEKGAESSDKLRADSQPLAPTALPSTKAPESSETPKKVGRPKKGKGRTRKNCSFDLDVAAFLETLADFSNYLEEFVKTDPQFAAFMQSRTENEETTEAEEEPEEKEPMVQVGVEVVTLACPTCGKNVDARDGTQLFDAEEWMRLPQMMDCVACGSQIKLPSRSPFKKTSKKKTKTIM